MSAIAGVGAYTGGEIWVHREDPTTRFVDIKNHFSELDGSRPHMTMRFEGQRFTMVVYTSGIGVKYLDTLSSADLRSLMEIGYALPSREEGEELVRQHELLVRARNSVNWISTKQRLERAYAELIQDRFLAAPDRTLEQRALPHLLPPSPPHQPGRGRRFRRSRLR